MNKFIQAEEALRNCAETFVEEQILESESFKHSIVEEVFIKCVQVELKRICDETGFVIKNFKLLSYVNELDEVSKEVMLGFFRVVQSNCGHRVKYIDNIEINLRPNEVEINLILGTDWNNYKDIKSKRVKTAFGEWNIKAAEERVISSKFDLNKYKNRKIIFNRKSELCVI